MKLSTGRRVVVQSFSLPNGNLLIPSRMGHDRTLCEWVEVAPGSSEHKRWLPVAVEAPDPREMEEYKAWYAEIQATPEYQEWLASKT